MIRIGKIAATRGLNGSLILTHIVGSSDWLKKEDVLFLELQKGSYIPFFVALANASGDEEYVIMLEDTTDVDTAKKLIGKNVYVKDDILSGHAKDSPLMWMGFNMVDKTKGTIGVIDDVFQAEPQWLAKVIYEGKEVLVPLVPQIVLDVNVRNKFIRVDLPEGLLEL